MDDTELMHGKKVVYEKAVTDYKERQRRSRVVETARLVAMQLINQPAKVTDSPEQFCPICFKIAERFEAAATVYLEQGKL